MTEWALTLTRDQIHRLTTAENIWHSQAAVVDDVIWIRGTGLDASVQQELVTLSDEPVLRISDGQLIPLGASVATGRLPQAEWRPLRELIPFALPIPAIPHGRISRTELTLRRTSRERTANLQLIDWDAWQVWALMAPENRLRKLRFVALESTFVKTSTGYPEPAAQAAAAESSGWLAVVLGTPLPGLSGRLFWMIDHVGRPMGYDIHPPVDAETIVQLLSAEIGEESVDYILLPAADQSPAGFSVTAIPRDRWLVARRANIRATAASIKEHPTT